MQLRNLLIGFLILLSAVANAQSGLKIVGSRTEDYTNGKYPKNDKLSFVYVKNLTGQDMTVRVYRVMNKVTKGQGTKFCWVNCFDTATSVSLNDNVILAGATDSLSFNGYFESNGIAGPTTVMYRFANTKKIDDSASIVFNYNANVSAINPSRSIAGFSLYPNPANHNLAVRYDLLSNETASLSICNILGVEVFKADLINGQNEQFVPIQALKEGIYFCNLIQNNKILNTRKLVISH